jgi:predicted dehydrogenase
MTRQIDRRNFLRTTAVLAAGSASAVPYHFTASRAVAESKNDRPNIGAIGVGIRGSGNLRRASKLGDVVAICDVDKNRAEKFKAHYGVKSDAYQDYRRLLDRKDVDVVIHSTPDHWHTAINIAACQAGKDIYAEKPLTLTIDEGKLLSKVVEDTKRIVQVGNGGRSSHHNQLGVEMVRNGRLGKLKQVWVSLPYFSTGGGPFPTTPVPESLDWDVYQGQAPVHDYCIERTHANFRWWYEYAGSIITDWGAHQMDVAHWGMDCELSGPVSVDEARGLFPNPKGTQYYNTPDRFFCRMQYPGDIEVLFFVALGDRKNYGKVKPHKDTTPEQVEWLFGADVPEEIKAYKRTGVMFIGEKGRICVNAGGVYGKPAEDLKENPLPENRWKVRPSNNHMGNFFDCVKSREEPVSTVPVQHRTITACHLTNISLRLGRKIVWDSVKQQIVGDDEANGWLKREQRAPYLVRA